MRLIDMHDYNAAARGYWLALVVCGSSALAYALHRLAGLPLESLIAVLAGTLLAAVVGLFPVRIPRSSTSISGGEIIIFFILLAYGMPAALLATAVESAVAAIQASKRATSRLASPAIVAVGMFVCGSIFEAVCGPMPPSAGNRGALVLSIIAFAGLYGLTVITMMITLFALKTREPLLPLRWLRERALIAVWYAASGAVAGMLFLGLERFGLAVVLAALPIIGMFLSTMHTLSQLEIANLHKSRFLANMSHELRTPLNCIIGGSELLKGGMVGPLTPRQTQWAKDIHESGTHLLTLINDILDLSKIEAGRMELQVAPLDLPDAIAHALILVQDRAIRHGIRLSSAIAPDLGPVAADERKLKQILLNLLSNAVKFTPDGGAVTVSARPVSGGVEIEVADTGIGIAKSEQEAIFEAFRQGGNKYHKDEGTGLGLALARDLTQLHGGALRLESEPGRGSTFTIFLPAAPAA